MPSSALSLDALLADPRATARALDCADARESLADFCGLIEIPGAPVDEDPDDEAIAFRPIERPQAKHHQILIEKLEAVERGDIRRLMVFMPPGSAKSTYASVVFPVWFMGKRRRRNVIVATYASDLARKIGRRARSILKQPVYREVFGTSLSADSSAADEWALDNENEFMGGGILSGITGNRADLIIIDDPIKGRQDADSETIREKTKSEYEDSIKTRLKPGGRIVLIQTRWHEDDLAGSLLPEGYDGESGLIVCRDGLEWEVLRIPAEADRVDDPLGRRVGEMLWTEWFTPDHWAIFRAIKRTWSALFQQSPTPGEGTFFQREWFRRYIPAQLPTSLRKYLTSDHAPTDGPDSDPSGCRVWGVHADKSVWMVDGFCHRETMEKTADKIVGNLKTRGRRYPEPPPMEGLLRLHKPFAWFPEDDNNWKTAAPFIRNQMIQEEVRTRIEPLSPHGQDKAAKAQSAQGMAAMGLIWIPVGPEGDAIIDQCVKFPAGAHDEEVDMLANICRAIDMAHPAIVPPEEKKSEALKGLGQMTMDEVVEQGLRPRVDRV